MNTIFIFWVDAPIGITKPIIRIRTQHPNFLPGTISDKPFVIGRELGMMIKERSKEDFGISFPQETLIKTGDDKIVFSRGLSKEEIDEFWVSFKEGYMKK